MDKETKALINFYDNKIKDLENKNKKIKEKYLNKIKETQKEYKGDNEVIHSICDGILLELLIELGYKEVAELFDVISDETPFWYA